MAPQRRRRRPTRVNVMPRFRFRIWLALLLVLPLCFVGFTAWETYRGGRPITGLTRLLLPLAWVVLCLAATSVLSLRQEARIFVGERSRLVVRAAVQAVFALAAILGTAFGQLVGMLAGIDWIPPDRQLAEDYALLFVGSAPLSFVAALPAGLIIALLIPRYWNSHLSLISQRKPHHA